MLSYKQPCLFTFSMKKKTVSVRVRFAGIAGMADFAEFAKFAEFAVYRVC